MSASATCEGMDSSAPHGSDSSTVAESIMESSSDGGSSRLSSNSGMRVRQDLEQAVAWSEVKFAHRIRPHNHHAHCVADVHLLSCFIELAQLGDIEGDAAKLLLRVLRLLHLCDFSMEDVASILAHASAYFVDAYALCGEQMDANPNEVGNVLATLLFIAHCYVQDETCPLHVWHRHLFRKYCTMETLNAAVVRLLEIRHYKLRLEPEDMRRRYKSLMQAVKKGQATPLLNAAIAAAHEEAKRVATAVIEGSESLRHLSLSRGTGGAGWKPKRRECTFSF